MKGAIQRLTQIEYSEENLPAILEALQAIEDKEQAQKDAWGVSDEPEQPVEEAPEEVEEEKEEVPSGL